MEKEDYPALFISSDNASDETQNKLLKSFQLNSIALIIASFIAFCGINNIYTAIASALFFVISLSSYIYSRVTKLQNKWYQTRALAESVKTSTWKLMMKADPFDLPDHEAYDKFRRTLKELLHENRNVGSYLSGDWEHQDQITQKMKESRAKSYEEKKEFYLKQRIIDQSNWYTKKSKENRESSKNWFIFLCITYGISIILIFLRIAFAGVYSFPVELFALIAANIISWTQIKRYDELSSSYGFASQEIGIIKSRYDSIKNEEKLIDFVSDAENAFSREHTQWLARRDH